MKELLAEDKAYGVGIAFSEKAVNILMMEAFMMGKKTAKSDYDAMRGEIIADLMETIQEALGAK